MITKRTSIPTTTVALVLSTFSGFYGVVVLDFVQFFIATSSMIALAVIAVVKVGGLGHVLDTILEMSGSHSASVTSWK